MVVGGVVVVGTIAFLLGDVFMCAAAWRSPAPPRVCWGLGVASSGFAAQGSSDAPGL